MRWLTRERVRVHQSVFLKCASGSTKLKYHRSVGRGLLVDGIHPGERDKAFFDYVIINDVTCELSAAPMGGLIRRNRLTISGLQPATIVCPLHGC